MRARIIVGSFLAALIIAALLLDGWLAGRTAVVPSLVLAGVNVGPWISNGLVTTIIVLVLTLITTHELIVLARGRGYRPFGKTAALFVLVVVAGPFVTYNLQLGRHDDTWGLFWMSCAVAITFVVQVGRYKTDNAMENLATTLFIIFYAGGLASFMTRLRMEIGGSGGAYLLLFSMFVVKMTDVGAYFVGRALGRHRMIEWLSPKKTWEGFAGGMATAVLCALLIGLWLRSAGIARLDERLVSPPVALAFLGALLGIFSVAGDLCASLLKRDAHVKDSGQALPGLGGVLDVFDSPLLAAPIAWLFWTRLFLLPTN